MLTRWVGAALLFLPVWLVLVIAGTLGWCRDALLAPASEPRPGTAALGERVAGATSRAVAWLQWASGWHAEGAGEAGDE